MVEHAGRHDSEDEELRLKEVDADLVLREGLSALRSRNERVRILSQRALQPLPKAYVLC